MEPTISTTRRKPSWLTILLQILSITPIIISAIVSTEADEAPAAIIVESKEGAGNINISASPSKQRSLSQ